ncbi:AraC family transcriptional regulator [Bacteroidales bacterium OttesenSCG-928-M11]|nr:AraC family transcriptional regulator [Bacteroidales bacterium OttesenSCG-928-M11]
MELLYKNEHSSCFNHDQSKKPMIEIVKIVKGKKGNLIISQNEIAFFLEGRFKYIFRDFPLCEAMKGQFIFLPAGGKFSYEALANSTIILFRLNNPIVLCPNFSIEKLYGIKNHSPLDQYVPKTKRFSILDINSRLWHFLDGVNDCLSDGIRCRCYFEMKSKELLLLLRAYYPKEDLYDFFFLILSEDTAFSEYVRLRWQQFHSVNELASSMNLTHKQFISRFVSVFGTTPQKWILEGRAKIVMQEIQSSRKPFKQIAIENGFASDTHFTRFCKKELGSTPTEIRERINIRERM